MGFFSAVKKFFGGGTEETKETQAAAVEKEAVATSVCPLYTSPSPRDS